MPQALVTTKLRAPKPRPNLVARPRLREVLVRHEGRTLTLVSAPAGFGKTTFLGEWSAVRSAEGCSVAWVSLEASDNDPALFLSYLVSALRTVEEGLGKGVLASLRSPESPPIEAVIGTLVNELAGIEQEVTVVLDDYHVIGSEAVHEATSFLLEHLPENVHLVISSRTDPPLPLPRLRARNQITELRAADLRFTPEEATAFLGDVMGLALSASDVAALEEITEGWIAALQLAALSMRDREDVSGFVESFSGSNRHVLDFLAEEVLGRQPEDVRDFLLHTSVLERMSAPLCDVLTGRVDGQVMLERLERENLFVVALDDERRWYRYHHLFADFLRGHLRHENPECASELHLRASGWHEENGHIAEAIGHALSAPDHERAARLIEAEIKHAWNRGEGPTVLRWLEALPIEAKRRRPRLLLQHAQALVLTGRPDDTDPLLQEAEREAEATGDDRRFLLGLASAIRSWRARLRGDAPHAVELARRALSLLPDEEAPQRIFAAFGLGEALRTTGDLAAASEAFAEAAELGRPAGRVYGPLMAMVWQARVQAERGRLREAEKAFRRALGFVREQGVELLPAAGVAHIGMGAPLYERNDLVHIQDRFRVMSYGNDHETSHLRTYAFRRGVRGARGGPSLLRSLRTPPLPDTFSQCSRRDRTADSQKPVLRSANSARCHPRLQQARAGCSQSELIASQRGPCRLRRGECAHSAGAVAPLSERIRQTEQPLDAQRCRRDELRGGTDERASERGDHPSYAFEAWGALEAGQTLDREP